MQRKHGETQGRARAGSLKTGQGSAAEFKVLGKRSGLPLDLKEETQASPGSRRAATDLTAITVMTIKGRVYSRPGWYGHLLQILKNITALLISGRLKLLSIGLGGW